MSEIIIIAFLIVSNGITLYWALTKRLKVSKQVLAIQNAVRAFEVEGQSILYISKINPDDVFMRNPSR